MAGKSRLIVSVSLFGLLFRQTQGVQKVCRLDLSPSHLNPGKPSILNRGAGKIALA